ncbi:Plasma membrane ATPase [Plasmodiophora brassicae]|uniref:Plasma membrane ATPase n=1 Tax=Plasmodiophora brassicae TaxID=37360 RepID=A0A0G4IW42_PLABS|nr:hypothetical protein PBRA_001368 [Plasmodiophora brassicae]SPQ97469.1 unnamed protein product [Plasmodiophora brassicae]
MAGQQQDPEEVVIYRLGAVERADSSTHLSRRDVEIQLKRYSSNPINVTELNEHQPHISRKPSASVGHSKGLTTAAAEELLKAHGPNQLTEVRKSRWRLLLEQFIGPMPIGIWIAIIIECILTNWVDMGVLLALQFINGFVGFYESNKADNAIAALKKSLRPTAHVKRDGQWQTINATLLVPGDLIALSAGSAVPADCEINTGIVSIDQSAMTGESMPVRMSPGHEAKMGSTVARGESEATVTATGMDTMYGKTAALLQVNDNSLGDLDKILLRIVLNLLIISVVLVAITLTYILVVGGAGSFAEVKEAISFNVVLLVASIPIAIEVVVTATLALGSRELTAHHAIVAKLTAIERLAGMRVLCSDKTGTLTMNKMQIQDECPTFIKGTTRDDVILYAALATKWNEPAKDALDTMILGVADIPKCNTYTQIEYIPFDTDRKRTESTVRSPQGQQFTVVKGAPDVLLGLCHNKDDIRKAVELAVVDLAARGIRSLAVAKTNEKGQVEMVAILSFLDPARPDAKETIERAKQYGITVKMITGDHQLVAQEMAKTLALGDGRVVSCKSGILPEIDLKETKGQLPKTLGAEYGDMIMGTDGFSQALPEHKFIIVEALKQRDVITGMTGDGVNDAPALKQAHVGVAVEGATDAARAAADIVLTKPGLNAIVEAILISRRIFARMNSFLIYRVAATLQLILFFFIAILAMHPNELGPAHDKSFPEFWSMPVTALITITVLNDGTIISVAYDTVHTSKRPLLWNIPRLWGMSITLGLVACASSLLMLWLALTSANLVGNSLFEAFGLGALAFDQVIVVMYLKVSLSDFMTLFTARTGSRPFLSQRPGLFLLFAGCVALGISTVFALYWPFGGDGAPIPGHWCGFIWLYCFVWFLVQDFLKVVIFKIVDLTWSSDAPGDNATDENDVVMTDVVAAL